MIQYTINPPEKIDANINLPSSKSISNRALVIYALSKGDKLPENLSDCDDTEVVVEALQKRPYEINVKAAGTAMRFMTAYFATQEEEHILTGTERMKHRPIKILVDALKYLGAEIEYMEEEGFPPLKIKGKKELNGGTVEIPGDTSSQFISALMMIGPVLKGGLNIRLMGNIVSRPYIDLTLCMMKEFGADADWTDVDMISISPKHYHPRTYLIENDWSAASYWYEILALNKHEESTIKLRGLMDGSRQGDSVVKYIFSLLGVKTEFKKKEKGVSNVVEATRHQRTLPRMDYDFTNSPDLAQTLVICCAALNIPFRFTGLASLKIKETDRIEAMKKELKKLGYVIEDENNNELSWNGERCEATMEAIDTYEDHRMALAFAPLSIIYPGLRINNPQVVTKSYPNFWEDLKIAGFSIKESEI